LELLKIVFRRSYESTKNKNLITLYKTHFKKIHNEEIYKWRAVKCFQENWNIKAKDFPGGP
jgi:hypothetical protein